MIDSVLNLVFRCSHRRLTRPVTPVVKPGDPREDTYVVCLDCGKHFAYDAIEMHLGRAIPKKAVAEQKAISPPEHAANRSRLKYLVWAGLVPIGFLLGSLIRNGRNRRQP